MSLWHYTFSTPLFNRGECWSAGCLCWWEAVSCKIFFSSVFQSSCSSRLTCTAIILFFSVVFPGRRVEVMFINAEKFVCTGEELVVYTSVLSNRKFMMTSSNGNIFCVTGPVWEEFIGHQLIPLTKASDAEVWCFLWSAPEQMPVLIMMSLYCGHIFSLHIYVFWSTFLCSRVARCPWPIY